MQFFLRNCTQILTRTKGKKFEDKFLVKIASKGTSLKCQVLFMLTDNSYLCKIRMKIREAMKI